MIDIVYKASYKIDDVVYTIKNNEEFKLKDSKLEYFWCVSEIELWQRASFDDAEAIIHTMKNPNVDHVSCIKYKPSIILQNGSKIKISRCSEVFGRKIFFLYEDIKCILCAGSNYKSDTDFNLFFKDFEKCS